MKSNLKIKKIRNARWHITLKVGLILLIMGSGPLFLLLCLDALGLVEAGNAIIPGILAFFSFYPSLILIFIGVVFTFFINKNANNA